MRTTILTLILSALSLGSFAQPTVTRTASLGGTIQVPPLVDLDVAFTVSNFHLQFEEWEHMDNGRIFPNALHVYVKSNYPWVVKVRSKDVFHSPVSSNGTPNIPSNQIQIRKSGDTDFMPLTTASQQILASTNNNIENHYYLDLKMNTNWVSNGGDYNLNVAFSISAP